MARRGGVRASLPSLDTLEDIAARAAGGDNEALAELGNLNSKLNRRLNQRMRELEKAGRTGDAYQRIKDSLGGKARGSQAKTGSAEDLFKSAEKALSGLNYKESTLTGIREVDTQTASKFLQTMGVLGDGQKATPEQVKRMNRFFGSSGWTEAKRAYGSRSEEMQELVDRIANDEDVDDLLQALEDFDAEEMSIFEVIEDFGIEF